MADGAERGGAPGDAPHLPAPVPIEAYGSGGFRFAGMSHRGSILCLPDGIWAWSVTSTSELTLAALERVFACGEGLDVFLIGAGRDPWILPQDLRTQFRALTISADAMTTGTAISTYNILLAENRRVGAALIAVG